VKYVLVFLEGFLAFVSPCVLPLLPIYFSYLGGNIYENKERDKGFLLNSVGFVIGFTFVYVILGTIVSLVTLSVGCRFTVNGVTFFTPLRFNLKTVTPFTVM